MVLCVRAFLFGCSTVVITGFRWSLRLFHRHAAEPFVKGNRSHVISTWHVTNYPHLLLLLPQSCFSLLSPLLLPSVISRVFVHSEIQKSLKRHEDCMQHHYPKKFLPASCSSRLILPNSHVSQNTETYRNACHITMLLFR